MVKRKYFKQTLFITSISETDVRWLEHCLNRFGFTPRYMTATEGVVILMLLS